jgi:hypothetical protein
MYPGILVSAAYGVWAARKGHRTSVRGTGIISSACSGQSNYTPIFMAPPWARITEKKIVLIQAATVHFDASIVSSRLRCMQSDPNLQSVNLMSKAGAELSPS